MSGKLDFDALYLHLVHDPAIWIRFDTTTPTLDDVQDARQVLTWGSEAPRVQFGEQFYTQIQIPGMERLARDRRFWERFRELRRGQRDGAVCARFGITGERYFVAILTGQKALRGYQMVPSTSIVQVDYEEGI